MCETAQHPALGVNLTRHLPPSEVTKVSSSSTSSHETLLASLSDLQFTLNESLLIADISSDTSLQRLLPRETLIGTPFSQWVRESDAQATRDAFTAAQADPGHVHRVDQIGRAHV